MSKDDGGSAFPESVRSTDLAGNPIAIIKNGMTLRDYFAAAALTGTLASGHRSGAEYGFMTNSNIAEQMYSIADAMLKERAKE